MRERRRRSEAIDEVRRAKVDEQERMVRETEAAKRHLLFGDIGRSCPDFGRSLARFDQVCEIQTHGTMPTNIGPNSVKKCPGLDHCGADSAERGSGSTNIGRFRLPDLGHMWPGSGNMRPGVDEV